MTIARRLAAESGKPDAGLRIEPLLCPNDELHQTIDLVVETPVRKSQELVEIRFDPVILSGLIKDKDPPLMNGR